MRCPRETELEYTYLSLFFPDNVLFGRFWARVLEQVSCRSQGRTSNYTPALYSLYHCLSSHFFCSSTSTQERCFKGLLMRGTENLTWIAFSLCFSFTTVFTRFPGILILL